MLVKFIVGNVLSFNEQQEFSMFANNKMNRMNERNYIWTDKQILRLGAIFGANASGKTNLIESLSIMKDYVKNTYSHAKYRSDYFLFNKPDKPSYFEVGILINDQLYAYGFEVILSQSKIISEWLYLIKGQKEEKIFEVDKDRKISWGSSVNKDLIKRIKVAYEMDFVQSDDLLITFLNWGKPSFKKAEGSEIFVQIYRWFRNNLIIISPEDKYIDQIVFEDNFIMNLSELLSGFDTGIKRVETKEVAEDEVRKEVGSKIFSDVTYTLNRGKTRDLNFKMKESKSLLIGNEIFIMEISSEAECKFKKLVFFHDDSETEFSYSNESDGTKRLIQISTILMSKNDDLVFLVDELERCLHPHLTWGFIESFLSRNITNRNQLIMATHELYIMNQDLLRRDEIWFTNKINNATELYSLSQFNVRNDKVILNGYNDGRFGGVPYINPIIDFKSLRDGKN